MAYNKSEICKNHREINQTFRHFGLQMKVFDPTQFVSHSTVSFVPCSNPSVLMEHLYTLYTNHQEMDGVSVTYGVCL